MRSWDLAGPFKSIDHTSAFAVLLGAELERSMHKRGDVESSVVSPAQPRNHLNGEEQKGLAQQIPVMPGIARNGSTNLRMIYVLITVYNGAFAHVRAPSLL